MLGNFFFPPLRPRRNEKSRMPYARFDLCHLPGISSRASQRTQMSHKKGILLPLMTVLTIILFRYGSNEGGSFRTMQAQNCHIRLNTT